MSKKHKQELPPCGLYRTGRALASSTEEVPSGILIMFHNHSNRGIPMVQIPDENHKNRWSFHKYGPGVEEDEDFLEALEPLREQGLYYLNEDLSTPDGILPRYTLVQLGYNLSADPILFLPEGSDDANSLFFPDAGYRFEDLDVLGLLRPSYPLVILGSEEEDEEGEESFGASDDSEMLN